MQQTDVTKKILIIDDSIEHIKILIALLEHQYDVYFAKSGKQGLQLLPSINPDLILLDIVMPEMDGFAVCREIKLNEQWREIPVIFISAQIADEDETAGLELGAIDYVTKPFKPAIVQARIRNHLQLRAAMQELERLYSLALDANPITGLAGNNTIAKYIENKLNEDDTVCVIYADIDNFKAFNDKYGFGRGDEVIRFTAEILNKAAEKATNSDSFVGHIGGDDFILVVPSEHSHSIAEAIVRNFDEGITQFYNPEDSNTKCIHSVNRQGEPQTYPIMTISLAVIDLSKKKYANFLEVNDACAEVKEKAKTVVGSAICFDRRK